MKKYIVTGGAGFIGSALANRLAADGHQVTVIDNLTGGGSSFDKLDERIQTVEDCMSSPTAIDTIMHIRPDTLFHLAAQPSVPYSVAKPIETTDINVMKTVKMLHECRASVGRVVFASSSSVYGDIPSAALPARESMPKRPASPYALHKSFIEDYGRIMAEIYGTDFVSLRFFNVYGPGQDTRSSYPNVVPAWLDAVTKKTPIVIYGDGTQSRDMAYIDDVVEACRLASSSSDRFRGECFNVAGGKSVVLNDIAEWFERTYGVMRDMQPVRPGDVLHTEADLTLSRDRLGYTPRTDIEVGLHAAAAWWFKRTL